MIQKKITKPKKTNKPESKQKVKKSLQSKKDVNPKEPKKMGRPTTYSIKLADQICVLISEGLSLRKVERELNVPKVNMLRWLVKYDYFRTQYEEAKQEGLKVWADEILDIADDATKDDMISDRGNIITDHENIARSRLRVDARKWLLSKLAPKKYGDKLEIDGTMKNIDVTKMSTEELRKLAQEE